MHKGKIVIYRYTGKQGLFTIPKEWCEECDLAIVLIQSTVRENGMENEVTITIRPWVLWAWLLLIRYFAWHPPIVTIGGKLISQGVVPTKEQIKKALIP